MPTVEIHKSNLKGKKFKIVLIYDDGRKKTIHIGQEGADDFTKTGDEEAKKRYITRHKSREDWTNINTAGFWAKHILWNKKTLTESIKDTEKRFKLKIKLFN